MALLTSQYATSPWDIPQYGTGTPGTGTGDNGPFTPNPWFNDWYAGQQNNTDPTYLSGGYDFDSMSDEELLQALGYDDEFFATWDGTIPNWDDPNVQFPDTDQPPNQPGQPGNTGGDGGYAGGYNPRPGYDSSPYINPIGGGVYGPSQPFYDFTTAQPDVELGQNRMGAIGWLHGADQSLLDELNRDQTMQSYILADMFNSPKGYGGILGGNTGYYDQSLLGGDRGEWQDILQQELVNSGMATGDELDNLRLKEHEAAKIEGSPYAAFDMARGEMAPLGESVDATSGQLRRVGGQLDTDMGEAINRDKLALDPAYMDNQYGVIDSSLDPFLAINDPANLGLSDEFNQNFQFGDVDRQAMMDQAARNVQYSTQASNDQLMREAAGRGNTSALALNRARQSNNLMGDVGAADAMTDAAARAKGIQLDVAQGREGMRLGTEQDMANRAYDYLGNTTNQYLDTIRGGEQMRLGTEQDISNRLTDAARTRADLGYRTESDIGDRAQDYGRYKINTLGQMMTDAERAAADRAVTGYQARTAGDQAAINTRFGQAMPASEALSSRFSNLYGQKKAEEAEGRNFLTNLYGTTMGNKRDTWNQRIGAANSMIGQANQASSNKKAEPTTWDRIMQGVNVVAGIAGKAFGG